MSGLTIGDLQALRIQDNRNRLKTTVCYREGGKWHPLEVDRIVNGLMTEVSQVKVHPEYLILYGHFTKERVLKAMLGGMVFTTTQHTGLKDLPFNPGWVP